MFCWIEIFYGFVVNGERKDWGFEEESLWTWNGAVFDVKSVFQIVQTCELMSA